MSRDANTVYILNTRKMIGEQLGWICAECGSYQNLQVHHIMKPLVPMNGRGRGQKRRALEWRKSLRVNNLKVLCDSCHVETHQKRGY